MPCTLPTLCPEARSSCITAVLAMQNHIYLRSVDTNWQGSEGIAFGDSPSCWSGIMRPREGGTHRRGIWHQNPYSLAPRPGPSHGAFWRWSHTCLLAAHIHVRMHTLKKKYDPCIFDLDAGCIHYQGAFVVKAPWRRRKLENYEFSSNSLERVKALLYMRQDWGGGRLVVIYVWKMYFNSKKNNKKWNVNINNTSRRPNITDTHSTTDDIEWY